jgi:hypothetical protein
MNNDQSQQVWRAYYQGKKAQRAEEAIALWDKMNTAGVTEETILAMDFIFLGASQQNVEALARQLSENYEMGAAPASAPGWWCANGTTRPHGVTLGREQFLRWVEFMCDVAESYACVFSSWSLESPELALHFRSESIPSAS